jgi:hypothetical protein
MYQIWAGYPNVCPVGVASDSVNKGTTIANVDIQERAPADICTNGFNKCRGPAPVSSFYDAICSGCYLICNEKGPDAPNVCEHALGGGGSNHAVGKREDGHENCDASSEQKCQDELDQYSANHFHEGTGTAC